MFSLVTYLARGCEYSCRPGEVTWHSEGQRRLLANINRHFYHPNLREKIFSQLADCSGCSKLNTGVRQSGHLAPRDTIISPSSKVHTDSIGPWRQTFRGVPFKFDAVCSPDHRPSRPYPDSSRANDCFKPTPSASPTISESANKSTVDVIPKAV